MKRGDLQRVLRHAREVRRMLENQKKTGTGFNLRAGRWPKTLEGACGLAAIHLAIRLRKPESMRVGHFDCFCCDDGRVHHAWNVVGGFIVDITATQFIADCKRVHVVHTNSKDARRYRERMRGHEAAAFIDEWVYRDWKKLRSQLEGVVA